MLSLFRGLQKQGCVRTVMDGSRNETWTRLKEVGGPFSESAVKIRLLVVPGLFLLRRKSNLLLFISIFL